MLRDRLLSDGAGKHRLMDDCDDRYRARAVVDLRNDPERASPRRPQAHKFKSERLPESAWVRRDRLKRFEDWGSGGLLQSVELPSAPSLTTTTVGTVSPATQLRSDASGCVTPSGWAVR